MTEPIFPTSIDSTMLSAFTDCPQKFYIEYMLRLAPQGRSPDLHGGGAVAAGMEATRKAFYHEHLPLEEAIGLGLEAFTEYWGDYEPPEKHVKSYVNMAHAFSEYWIKWDPRRGGLEPIDLPSGASAIEFTFALPTRVRHPVTGDPILYSGRCDLVGVRNGEVVVVDEKTTRSLGPSFYRKWAMRGQFLGYTYAVNQTGLRCESALIRALCIQVTDLKLEEVAVSVPYFKQLRWWEATQNKIQEIVDRWAWMQEERDQIQPERYTRISSRLDRLHRQNEISHDCWPYAFAEACEHYGGCTFKSLCSREHPHLHYSSYDTRLWDPLAKDPTAKSINQLDGMSSISLPPEVITQLGRGK